MAFQRSLEWGEKVPIGLFYKVEKPTYEDLEEVLHAGPLAKQSTGLRGHESVLDEFT
jgi:2-oxoglutarate ferredoxin oxidoreductase subunit beta